MNAKQRRTKRRRNERNADAAREIRRLWGVVEPLWKAKDEADRKLHAMMGWNE